MTDKEIIINGVDVRGCEFFFKDNINGISTQALCACMEEHTGTDSYKTECLSNPNCYYKQSARKDERIRELEEKNKRLEHFYKQLTRQGENLTASQFNSVITIGQCIGADIYIDENRDLKQKLSQIAELAENIENIYEVLKDMDFEKRCRFFIARTSSNPKIDLWEFKNFMFSFIQPIYEQHVKHLQQIKQITGEE